MRFRDFLQRELISEVLAAYAIPLAEASWPEEYAQEIFSSPNFQQLLNDLGVNGEIRPLGEGGVGRAYALGNQYVIKFTADRKEADAAAVIQKNPSDKAARVHHVARVKSLPHGSLYLIIMDRLNTGVGKRYRIAGNLVYDYMDNNPGPLGDLNQVFTKIVEQLPPKSRNDTPLLQAIKSVLNSVGGLYQQSAVLTQDTHGGNIAFKNRTPAFFDFGRSQLNLSSPKLTGVRIPVSQF